MADAKRTRSQRLDKSISLLQTRYGPRAVQPASTMPRQQIPPHISTGFTQLDAITGCAGIPLSAITLFTGQTTSGKLTLAYTVLANAQHARRKRGVAILDLTYTANPDYLVRCGVDLEYCLFARAPSPLQTVDVIFDLVRSELRLLVVDGLPDLLRDAAVARRFDAALPELQVMLASLPCAVIFMDEPRAPWLRWLRLGSSAIAHCAALHVDLKREQWLERRRELIGYRAQAQVMKSRWARSGQTAPVEIVFDGANHTRGSW
ncbi:MAG TPA: hypothetical protein VGK81_04195 [Anaerolineae bacterium]